MNHPTSVIQTCDFYAGKNLPKRFNNPHWFKGYGNERFNQINMRFLTTAFDYGRYPPSIHTIPLKYVGTQHKFTESEWTGHLYRNHSVNVTLDKTFHYRKLDKQ